MPGDLSSRSLYNKSLYEKSQKPERIPRKDKWLLLLLLLPILAVAAFFVVIYMNRMGMDRAVQKYLREKYPDQEFIIISIRSTSNRAPCRSYGAPWNKNSKYIVCYPKGGDPETDKFDVFTYRSVDENGEKGEREFMDNYFAILIREDVEADVLDMLSDMNLPMKVYYWENMYYDADYDSTDTYADLKQDILEGKNDRWINVSIFLLCNNIENSKQYAQQIYDTLLSENGVIFSSDVYMVADETIYKEITRKNYYDLYQEHDEAMVKFYESLDG